MSGERLDAIETLTEMLTHQPPKAVANLLFDLMVRVEELDAGWRDADGGLDRWAIERHVALRVHEAERKGSRR